MILCAIDDIKKISNNAIEQSLSVSVYRMKRINGRKKKDNTKEHCTPYAMHVYFLVDSTHIVLPNFYIDLSFLRNLFCV